MKIGQTTIRDPSALIGLRVLEGDYKDKFPEPGRIESSYVAPRHR